MDPGPSQQPQQARPVTGYSVAPLSSASLQQPQVPGQPQQQPPPPVKIYNAVYSSVQVYECMIRGIAVMRRRADSYVNATQILKVAGVDKGRRTKILEKDILTGKHEIVQGGYGKYQGTWIPLEKGREIATQYGVAPLLAPLFDFTPSTTSLQALPVSTPLFTALSSLPSRPLSATSTFTGFSASPGFPRSPSIASPGGREGTPGPNPLAPPPIMPGSALRLLNQGRAQGLFTPSTSLLHPHTHQVPRQVSPHPPSSAASPTPPPIGSGIFSPTATPTGPQHLSVLSTGGLPASNSLKRHLSDTDMSAPLPLPDIPSSMPDLAEPTAKRARIENGSAAAAHGGIAPPPLGANMLRLPTPPSHPQRPASVPAASAASGPISKSAFLTTPVQPVSTSTLDMTPHTTRFSTKVSPIYTRDTTPLKDSRRAAVINMICQSDDASAVLDTLKSVGNAGLSYVSPNAENAFDPDTPLDPTFHTAMHFAAALSRTNILSALLANNADAHKGNHLGETPLIRTVLSSNASEFQSMPSILSLLGSTIWTLDAGGRSVLHHVCHVAGVKGRAHIAKYYLDTIFTHIATHYSGDYKSIVDIQDEHGDTALLTAARVGNKSLVRAFLDVGADATLMNKLGLRAGDFGVTDELIVGGRDDTRLTVLRPGAPAPVQKSQDVIADMTAMIQSLSTEFQSEIKTKQDALDVTQAHLRAATRELSEQRRQIQLWQQRLGELDQSAQRARNMQRAIEQEDTVDWTGRIRPPLPPSTNIDPAIMMNKNKDNTIVSPPSFAYRGVRASLGKVDNLPPPPSSHQTGPEIPADNSQATLIKLRRMKLWYSRVNEMVKKKLEGMKGDSAEREFLCRKIVAICTGLSVSEVDARLDDLIAGLEADGQNVDVARISGFLQRVQT